jgi:hypothetical protein
MNCRQGISSIKRDCVLKEKGISETNCLSHANHIVGSCLPMTRVYLMNLPKTILGFSIAEDKMLVESEVVRRGTFAVRIARKITSRLSVRSLKNSPRAGMTGKEANEPEARVGSGNIFRLKIDATRPQNKRSERDDPAKD